MTDDLPTPHCTPEQAQSAVEYVRHAFGGWPIPDQEQRAHVRLYLDFTPAEVRTAIDTLVRTASRRPAPNEIAQVIRRHRRNVAEKVEPIEPGVRYTPPELMAPLMDAVRAGDMTEIRRLSGAA